MSNTDNLLLPILKNIQKDISEMKTMKTDVSDLKTQMETISMYITYTIGMHTENSFKIEEIEKKRLDAIEKRLETLEARG